MFKWILFDQANVLTHHVFTTKPIYCTDNQCFPAKDLEKIYYIPEYSEFELGRINSTQLIDSFLKKYKLCLTVPGYRKLYRDSIEPIKGMRDIVEALKAKFRLATLINEGAEWAEHKFDTLGYKHLFEKNIISGDMGIAKPDERIYRATLRDICAEPGDCLFIDDQEKNCVAAEKLGIKSILFTRPPELLSSLETLSIYLNQ